MTPPRLARLAVAPLAFLLPLLLGCGGASRTVAVKGKVVPPANVKFQDNDNISITFIPDGDKGKAATASATGKDPSFTAIAAGVKEGIVPGKYKVAVEISGYPGMPGWEQRGQMLSGINKNFDRSNSKLSYEVTPGAAQNITIDLNAGTVTKG